MNIGEFRHRLTLQTITAQNPDAAGQSQPTWTTATTRWGKVEPLTGRELFRAQQLAADVTHRITIRHHGTLTAAGRILFGSRVFNLLLILNPLEKNKTLEILAKETVA